jgi:hypothetical protein
LKASRVDQVAALRRPQAQGVDALAAPAHHRRVVGDRQHALPALPGLDLAAPRAGDLAHVAVEADRVGGVRPLELPRVAEGEPVLGPLDLPAVVEALLEQPVLVADAVAEAGDAQRGHAVHQAGGEAAQAAVAERRVRLDLERRRGIDAEVGQGRPRRLG